MMIHTWTCRRQGGKLQKLIDILTEMEQTGAEKTVIFALTKPRSFNISSLLAVDGFSIASLTRDEEIDKEGFIVFPSGGWDIEAIFHYASW